MDIDEKAFKRNLLGEFKTETLQKDDKLINKFKDSFLMNEQTDCDLIHGKIYLNFCETIEEKQKWKAFVHLTTSLPYRGAVGRQIKVFVMCDSHILGMVHLTSPLAQSKVRDEYLNFDDKWEQLKNIYNLETCVPTRRYANYLTGKLLVYCIFSNETYEYIKSKYGNYPTGFETTSLFGKSSIYNRIPFFKYLGLTEGLSAVYLKDEIWKKILKEYYEVYPNTKTKRLAPVKFQIVDKLNNYYKQLGKTFPYEYKSESFKRGVYFGHYTPNTLDERVEEWRKRWLENRLVYISGLKKGSTVEIITP